MFVNYLSESKNAIKSTLFHIVNNELLENL